MNVVKHTRILGFQFGRTKIFVLEEIKVNIGYSFRIKYKRGIIKNLPWAPNSIKKHNIGFIFQEKTVVVVIQEDP